MNIRLNDLTGYADDNPKMLMIYDLYGRKIFEKDFARDTGLDTGAWSPGIYVVAVERKGAVIAREKLVVL